MSNFENHEAKAAEQTQGPRTASTDAKVDLLTEAFELGYASWNEGVPFIKNPMPVNTDLADAWNLGWNAADDDNGQFGVGA